MDLCEGQILAGKYRVERVLGRGGMGVVVAAHHLLLDEKVAIKFLLPEALANPDAVGRFAREARAAVKIKSEHVARVSDVGTLENGAAYLVMEYLEGLDLGGWLAQHGPLPIEQAVEFVLQASEAIAEAHSLGIVHRDLKPANLFVIRRPDGALSTKVLDFGISRTTDLGPTTGVVTQTATVMGSPLYMSPEQMRSAKDVDARTDIWALGVVLYELLAGQPPFPGSTMPELVLKVVTNPPNPIRVARPDVPAGLEAVLLKCLEKDRELRYQTIGELAPALFEFAPASSRASVERISGLMQRAGGSLPPAPLASQSSQTIPTGQTQPPASRTLADLEGVRLAPNTLTSFGRTSPPATHRKRLLIGALLLAALPLLALSLRAMIDSRAPQAALPSASALGPASFAPQELARPSSAPPVEPSATSAPTPHLEATGRANTTAVVSDSVPQKAPPHPVTPPHPPTALSHPLASGPLPTSSVTAPRRNPLDMKVQ